MDLRAKEMMKGGASNIALAKYTNQREAKAGDFHMCGNLLSHDAFFRLNLQGLDETGLQSLNRDSSIGWRQSTISHSLAVTA